MIPARQYIDRLHEERDQKNSRIQELTQEMATATGPANEQYYESKINEIKATVTALDNRLREGSPRP